MCSFIYYHYSVSLLFFLFFSCGTVKIMIRNVEEHRCKACGDSFRELRALTQHRWHKHGVRDTTASFSNSAAASSSESPDWFEQPKKNTLFQCLDSCLCKFDKRHYHHPKLSYGLQQRRRGGVQMTAGGADPAKAQNRNQGRPTSARWRQGYSTHRGGNGHGGAGPGFAISLVTLFSTLTLIAAFFFVRWWRVRPTFRERFRPDPRRISRYWQ